MRGHALEHDRGGDLEIDGVWQFEQVPAWHGIQFGVGAVAVGYAIGDAIADFDVFDFGDRLRRRCRPPRRREYMAARGGDGRPSENPSDNRYREN